MINNRQAGRRRGRNNPRQNGGGNRGNGDSGNRIDSRARGNAAQLLEKYRNLARDAQMAGDRVNAEYYFQFADHYFRVLADNRARQEEQQARFRRPEDNEQDLGDEGDDAFDVGADDGDDFAPPQQQPQQDMRPRRERDRDRDRDRDRNRDFAGEGGSRRDGGPRRRQSVANDDSGEEQGDIGLPSLPPSIARVDTDFAPEAAVEADEPAPKPRRGRRPRASEAAE